MANIIYRTTSATPTRSSSTIKGNPLTNTEIDGNFKVINNELVTVDGRLDSAEGRLDVIEDDAQYYEYDVDNKVLKVLHTDGTEQSVGVDFFAPLVINNTGSTISKGTFVMRTGVSAGGLTVAPAVTDGTYETDVLVGFALTDILDLADDGRILTGGVLGGLDTSSWSAGDELYPDPSNPGQLTTTKPFPPNIAVLVAVVLVSDATDGVLYVKTTGAGGGGSSGFWTFLDNTDGGYTTVTEENVVANTVLGSFTVNLPASPAQGFVVSFFDGNNWNTNNLTIGRNGSTIEGDAEDLILDVGHVNIRFIYNGTTWKVYTDQSAAELPDITGNNGLILSNNGATSVWRAIVVNDLSDATADGKTLLTSNDAKPFTSAEKTKLSNAVEDSDVRLSDPREWTASIVSQPEAEAGTGTTTRKWTAQRVRQAIAAWWTNVALAAANTFTGRQKFYSQTERFIDGGTGGNYTVNLANGNVFRRQFNAAATISVSNVPATDSVFFLLEAVNPGASGITLPGGVRTAGGAAYEPTASGTDYLFFHSRNGGTTWIITVLPDVKVPA